VTKTGAPTPESVTSREVGVWLVGAGPGDADLLTLRAEGLLAATTSVVVDEGLVALAAAFAPGATIVAVPERAPAVDVLLATARRSPVVRLYRGDTWLHPAHGPESAALAAAGIGWEAVAGVATEVALPGLAGIPVHHRRLAVACTIAIAATGHGPSATDPARTVLVPTDDLQAAALATAGTGDRRLPAAAVEPTGATIRATLGDLVLGAPARPGVLVAGAVAAVAAAPHRQDALR
jgi:siroheme synthase